jgi:hypothetical protein
MAKRTHKTLWDNIFGKKGRKKHGKAAVHKSRKRTKKSKSRR